ncbi:MULTISPECIES: hypothetical protein [Polaromonas]|uniref:Uncharacterized protein n=1 Tax=Polaromonas aquatica TaxID=332657 RepID=A0ABW1TYY9_9BURK
MNAKHTPSPPPPHKLADWLHQQFLQRAAPPAYDGPSPWADSNLSSALTRAVLPTIDLTFTRREVESGRIGSAVDRLMALTDTPMACAQNMSRLRLAFSGYNREPHEIAQIRAIAHFFQAITTQWPYWMHFLSPQADNMATLLSLNFNPLIVNVQGERVNAHIELSEPAIANFQTMAQATINLHNAMAAPQHITQTMGSQLRHALCLVLA